MWAKAELILIKPNPLWLSINRTCVTGCISCMPVIVNVTPIAKCLRTDCILLGDNKKKVQSEIPMKKWTRWWYYIRQQNGRSRCGKSSIWKSKTDGEFSLTSEFSDKQFTDCVRLNRSQFNAVHRLVQNSVYSDRFITLLCYSLLFITIDVGSMGRFSDGSIFPTAPIAVTTEFFSIKFRQKFSHNMQWIDYACANCTPALLLLLYNLGSQNNRQHLGLITALAWGWWYKVETCSQI
jgi:hypothetical protein